MIDQTVLGENVSVLLLRVSYAFDSRRGCQKSLSFFERQALYIEKFVELWYYLSVKSSSEMDLKAKIISDKNIKVAATM